MFAILQLIWLQIGWVPGFFTIPLSHGKVIKSSSGKKWTALSLCLAGGPIFYTGWAPPDLNVLIISMYRCGRSVVAKTSARSQPPHWVICFRLCNARKTRVQCQQKEKGNLHVYDLTRFTGRNSVDRPEPSRFAPEPCVLGSPRARTIVDY